ncbi:hypothetical protein P171DRAFT_438900 [Karstenula rhodostoma CBS 690.94]|uniref:Uncharacterized protein n=1 Tax=Karstenula rhodostoma CBS 690.94 TaxID=1392251 RepID=A0A9P4UFN5_9PLEO|nr:hypothetical protein P171DRAFT_438900 [Karstenula rhodostoma CBS 690.94]
MPPFPTTVNTSLLHLRNELEAAQAANEKYNPFKVILAVLGILALQMLFIVIVYFAWSRRQKKKALEQRNSKDFAMVELFGGSQHVKGLNKDDFEDVDLKSGDRKKKAVTRWSFARHFAKSRDKDPPKRKFAYYVRHSKKR